MKPAQQGPPRGNMHQAVYLSGAPPKSDWDFTTPAKKAA